MQTFQALLVSFLLLVINTSLSIETTITRHSFSLEDPKIPLAVRSVCPGGPNATTITDFSSFGTSGLTMTRGVCSPLLDGDSELERRSIADTVARKKCPLAPNECVNRFGTAFQGNGFVNKCSAPCNSTCLPEFGRSNIHDCKALIETFHQMNSSQQLFTLEYSGFMIAGNNTCATIIINQMAPSPLNCSQTMIYSYNDWAGAISNLTSTCQGVGGQCNGTTGLYQPDIPDFYIDVTGSPPN